VESIRVPCQAITFYYKSLPDIILSYHERESPDGNIMPLFDFYAEIPALQINQKSGIVRVSIMYHSAILNTGKKK